MSDRHIVIVCALSLLVACGGDKPPAGSPLPADGGPGADTRAADSTAPPSGDTLAFSDMAPMPDTQPAADGSPPPAADAQPAADASPAADATPAADSGGTPASKGCNGQVPATRDYTLTITHGGIARTALVHLPPSYDGKKPMPMVFNNHGNLHSAPLQADMSQLDARADTRGVITVAPQGTGGLFSGWNVGKSPIGQLYTNVDDVGFFGALIDEMQRTRCIDSKRVYCTGFSLGGSMCYRLACDLADRITAFASVSGPDGTQSCAPARRVPLLHIHGTADNFAGYNSDGNLNKGVLGYVPEHAKRVGCSASKSVSLTKGAVVCYQFGGCPAGVEVGHCDVNGFGHSWPGGKGWLLSGPVNQDIDASSMILDFFLKYSL
ncbi:MAG: dienelactone hydrolase family protein [Myxococcales bacterium]|nr:dienelactone hydrolase family protein [Myxococcales bacterium]